MQEHVTVTGMVIKSEPVGDYDRRVVILTAERGKITAFAKGARRPNSRFVACTNSLSFGRFYLYEGRNSYSITEAEIQNYFEELHGDIEGVYYAMYFLEIADYYTRENNDEKEMLKLLYQSMRALLVPAIDNKLVRAVYEIKSVVVNGEFRGVKSGSDYDGATLYALDYIISSSIEKLYTFALKEEVLKELMQIAEYTSGYAYNTTFKSLEILDTIIS